MKTLALIPIHNQENRIQPLFRAIENDTFKCFDEIMFIDENSSDKSVFVLNLEFDKQLKIPYKFIKLDEDKGRGFSFGIACDYAIENNFDYIITYNEGWSDNLYEMSNIINSKEFTQYDLVTSCRHVYEFSLGTCINIFSNLFATLLTGQLIKETKGDSINIVKVSRLVDQNGSRKKMLRNGNLYYLDLILFLIKNQGALLFTDVDNGLSIPSRVKLNTVRAIKVISTLIKYKLRLIF